MLVKRRHTSVVVFGKEVFYGQGISVVKPGQSHVSSLCACGLMYVMLSTS